MIWDEQLNKELEVCKGDDCAYGHESALFSRRQHLVVMDRPVSGLTLTGHHGLPTVGISHGSLPDYKAPVLASSESESRTEEVRERRKRQRASPGKSRKLDAY